MRQLESILMRTLLKRLALQYVIAQYLGIKSLRPRGLRPGAFAVGVANVFPECKMMSCLSSTQHVTHAGTRSTRYSASRKCFRTFASACV